MEGKFRTSIIVDPPNGRMPETTPAAKERRAARDKLRRPNDGSAWWLDIDGPGPYDGPESLPITERCIVGFTGATPTLPSAYNNYKRVVQTEDHIMILIEMNHDARIVRLNDEHPSPEERKWLGDSVGWWEGDTLVIDSVNFHPRTFLRGSTQELHVTERLDPPTERRHPLPVHDGRSGHLGDPLVRRVHLEEPPGTRLRVRLPRGQLRDGEHAARCADSRGGRGCGGGSGVPAAAAGTSGTSRSLG